MKYTLLSVGHNNKTVKSDKLGEYLTGILYLAPYKTSGYNLCPNATVGCSTGCLYWAGFGRYTSIQQSRIKKTKLFIEERELFKKILTKDINAFLRECKQKNRKPCLRLNGLSDIPLENIWPSLFNKYDNIQFYDYTKSPKRMNKFLNRQLPRNYYLIFSRSENNEHLCPTFLRRGGNVAIVFEQMPKLWNRFKVIDGDKHDLRFIEPRPRVVGLLPKGRAKHDTTGFVLRNKNINISTNNTKFSKSL